MAQPAATNLNFLFQDQIRNFAHLITIEPQTKAQFTQTVKDTYSSSNPKTALFVASIEQSTFESIRLNNSRDSILFNQ
jgi:hypothetical protein